MRVLLVEDDQMMAKNIENMLNSEGFNDQSNDSKPSLENLSKILDHKEPYFTKKFVDRINFN